MRRGRLKSSRGASAVLALIVLLVCSACAAAALLSARSAVGGREQYAESQQEYLALASAVGLLRGDIESAELTLTLDGATGKTEARCVGSLLGSELAKAAAAALADGSAEPICGTLECEGFDSVDAALYMDSVCDITAELSVNGHWAAEMLLTASITEAADLDAEIYITEIEWNFNSVSRVLD